VTIVATVAVADMQAANAALDLAGFGPRNFSVAAFAGPGVTHGAMCAWDDQALLAALQAIPSVTVSTSPDEPATAFAALLATQSARWGDQAPALPTTGNAVASTLYRYDDGTLWWCIQTFDRGTFNAHPDTYPALIRQVRIPGTVAAWKQPTDQFDAYKLVNPFTGQPDECTHAGNRWRVSQADGGGNNVFEPGVFGWTQL
jgi:hypothetical protein